MTEEANLSEDKIEEARQTATVSTTEERTEKSIGQKKPIQSGVSDVIVKIICKDNSTRESILPNFNFSGFPIFAVKLESL